MKLDYTKVAVLPFRDRVMFKTILKEKKRELSLAKGAIHVNDLGS